MGIKPLFTTAPRCKLQIGDNDVAYAIGFNVSVSVDITPIHVMGQFHPIGLEPTFYNVVTGTIQIQKLMSVLARSKMTTAAQLLASNDDTNIVSEKFQSATVDEKETYSYIIDNETAPEDSAYSEGKHFIGKNAIENHLNPSDILASETFQINVYLRKDNDSDNDAAWLEIVDCRLSTRNVNITLGQLVNEPVNFQGLLLTPSVNSFKSDAGAKDRFNG